MSVITINENPQSRVAVIFIHGLGGQYWCSWAMLGNGWDKDGCNQGNVSHPLTWFDIIKADSTELIPGFRLDKFDLYSVDYNKDAKSRFSLDDLALTLSRDPGLAKTILSHEITVFICHSMGGLILERAVLRWSENKEKINEHPPGDLISKVAGFYFLGTLFNGSPLASLAAPRWYDTRWSRFVEGYLGASYSLVTELKTPQDGANFIDGLNARWLLLLKQNKDRWKVGCFFETLPEVEEFDNIIGLVVPRDRIL